MSVTVVGVKWSGFVMRAEVHRWKSGNWVSQSLALPQWAVKAAVMLVETRIVDNVVMS